MCVICQIIIFHHISTIEMYTHMPFRNQLHNLQLIPGWGMGCTYHLGTVRVDAFDGVYTLLDDFLIYIFKLVFSYPIAGVYFKIDYWSVFAKSDLCFVNQQPIPGTSATPWMLGMQTAVSCTVARSVVVFVVRSPRTSYDILQFD